MKQATQPATPAAIQDTIKQIDKLYPRDPKRVQQLRKEIVIMRAARAAGQDLSHYAAATNQRIKRAHYSEIKGILSDTMAIVDGCTVLTEHNLQYYPAKFRYVVVQ